MRHGMHVTDQTQLGQVSSLVVSPSTHGRMAPSPHGRDSFSCPISPYIGVSRSAHQAAVRVLS